MFGAICAGHPVQTNLRTLSETQYLFLLPPSPPFHHLVVFLLPDTVLPPNSGAAVYIRLPPPTPTQSPPPFSLLGFISAQKPSAIFRINRPSSPSSNISASFSTTLAPDEDAMTDSFPPQATPLSPEQQSQGQPEIELGISLEPLDALLAQAQSQAQSKAIPTSSASAMALVPTSKGPSSATAEISAADTAALAKRIIEDAFNYLASFSVSIAEIRARAGAGDGKEAKEEMVPLRAFRDWWAKFEGKLARAV